MTVSYKSDIKLGEKYRDDQTGFEGVATVISFFQHGCERASLEIYDEVRKVIVEQSFDVPRLTHVGTGKTATTTRTGGPGDAVSRRGPVSR